MSVTVIGSWEPDWMDAEKTERRLWTQTIHAYNVDKFYMVPPNRYTFTSPIQKLDVAEALTVGDLGKRVFLIPQKTVEASLPGRTVTYLHNYTHPTDAIYIIGSGAQNLVSFVRDEDDVVSFLTPSETDMFGCVALGIVLADRVSKVG